MRWHRPLAVVLSLVLAGTAAAADAGRGKQWNLDRIGAPAPGATGGGVVVAVVDSGVDLDHPDLGRQLVPGRDFVEDDDRPDDPYGHGTHVAGIVAAATGGGEVVGVAPAARVMPVRVLDEAGGGTVSDVVDGVRWAVANGARVINLSLGEDAQALLGPSIGDVLREAWEAGAVPVVAAGNQFVTGSGFSDEPALVVTATTRSDGKPSYSSGVGAAQWGVAAPGGESPDLGPEGAILSTYKDGGYAWVAGTSQAAPHVSGAVAVLLSLGLSPQQAVDRVLATAVDLGPAGRDSTFGAGRLDLRRAVDGLTGPRSAPSSPPPPARRTPPPETTAAPPSSAAPATSAPPTTQDPATTSTLDTTTAEDGVADAEEPDAAVVALPSSGDPPPDDEPVPPALAVLAAALAALAAAGTANEWLAQRRHA